MHGQQTAHRHRRPAEPHLAKGRTPELRDTPWRQFSVSSHLRIIDALERRSPEDSRKALEEHIDTVIHKHLFATVRD